MTACVLMTVSAMLVWEWSANCCFAVRNTERSAVQESQFHWKESHFGPAALGRSFFALAQRSLLSGEHLDGHVALSDVPYAARFCPVAYRVA